MCKKSFKDWGRDRNTMFLKNQAWNIYWENGNMKLLFNIFIAIYHQKDISDEDSKLTKVNSASIPSNNKQNPQEAYVSL